MQKETNEVYTTYVRLVIAAQSIKAQSDTNNKLSADKYIRNTTHKLANDVLYTLKLRQRRSQSHIEYPLYCLPRYGSLKQLKHDNQFNQVI